MAGSTIDSELIYLNDNWPGAPQPALTIPDRIIGTDGADQHAGHNVSTPQYDIGTKMGIHSDGTVGVFGQATLIYLQVGTQNSDSTILAKTPLVPDSKTDWYQLTNDPDDCVLHPTGQFVIALTAMTDAYYGWFWCGGVCPEVIAPSLGGDYLTDNNVTAGSILVRSTDDDGFCLGIFNADESTCVGGFALAADA